jgi:hypothetical protein
MTQVGATLGAAEVAESLLRRWQEYLTLGIAEMQANGGVDPKLDAERTAAGFVAGIQGGVQILRSTGNSAHLEAAIDTLIGYLRSRGRLE